MKNWITLLITSFLIITGISGENSLGATSVDNLASACVFLCENENEKSKYGSGFFVQEKNNLYLVTAAHVAVFLNIKSPIMIKKYDGSPAKFIVNDLIPSAEKLSWVQHEHADIAVLPMTPNPEFIRKHLAGHFIPRDWIEEKEIAPERQKTITILGFPFRLGTRKVFSPISRDTQAASGLLEIKNTIFFITQDPSVGGFSGGPVFDRRLSYADASGMHITSGLPKLVGLVHGVLSDKTGGKFGAIVPGYLILETIKKAQNK